MVNIWLLLMTVNKYMVGGWPTILKNMQVNGKDYPIYYGK